MGIENNIEIEGEEGNASLRLKGFKYSPVSIMIHLERLKGLKFVSKSSWYLTDDFEAVFEYKGYSFILWTPLAEVEVESLEKNAPKKLMKEVFEHIFKYKTVWFHTRLIKGISYVFLPFQPRN